MKIPSFIVGAAAMVGAYVLRSHYEPTKQLCESGVGAVGQAFSSSVQQHCTIAEGLADLGTVVLVIGAVMIGLFVLVLLVGGLSLMGKRSSSRARTPGNPHRAAATGRATDTTAQSVSKRGS